MAEEHYVVEAEGGRRWSYFKSPLFRIIIGVSAKCYSTLPWIMRPLPVVVSNTEDIAWRYGLKGSRAMEGRGEGWSGWWMDKVHGVQSLANEYAVQWLALAEAYHVFAILIV